MNGTARNLTRGEIHQPSKGRKKKTDNEEMMKVSTFCHHTQLLKEHVHVHSYVRYFLRLTPYDIVMDRTAPKPHGNSQYHDPAGQDFISREKRRTNVSG